MIYVCLRDPSQTAATARAVKAIADRLQPDNLPEVAPRILTSGSIVAGISDASDLIVIRGMNLAAGYLVDPVVWERPRTGRPDGAYALFRSDDAVVEIVSDSLASRTVWYALTDEMFVAATSQRAIVALLRSFDFNPSVVPWMLTTGSLGPGLSWDSRIRCVAGATTVTLDRKEWTVEERTEPIRFIAAPISDDEHESRLVDALKQVVGTAQVADSRWAIALSGGIDSRVILCLLEETTGLRAVTWGLRDSLAVPMNDAQIASRLAQHFGLEHKYFETDLAEEPIDRVFARFVANGEARTDRISGYADGFQLWSRMVDAGIRGIIRGEQVFGHRPVRGPVDVRARAGLPLWSDFGALPPLERFDLRPPALPEGLEQRNGESLETWRDRLFEQFRVPFVYGALSDLKLPYVEIITPLLSDSLIGLIRQLPDKLRTSKALLRRIAGTMNPNIPFASSTAIQSSSDILKSPRVVEFLRDSLSGNSAGPAIPGEFAAFAVAGLAQTSANQRLRLGRRWRGTLKAWAPSWTARPRTRVPQVRPDHNRLAFRAFLVSQATRVFAQDAESLRRLDPVGP